MAVSRFIPSHGHNYIATFSYEKWLLHNYYKFLSSKIENGNLIVSGNCCPSEFSKAYEYKVIYKPREVPKVYVVNPKIEYSSAIHMYSDDKSLCLYYPPDFKWTHQNHLHDTIIPWTHEWFLFYELYRIKGRWLHPEVSHTNNLKK